MSDVATSDAVTVDGLHASVYQIPTDQPEADGTLAWDSTTLVVVEATGGGRTGPDRTTATPAPAARR